MSEKKNYVIVDYLSLDPTLITYNAPHKNDEWSEPPFNKGSSVPMRYNGKALYVRYPERHPCPFGIVQKNKREYSLSINMLSKEDPYYKKTEELPLPPAMLFHDVMRSLYDRQPLSYNVTVLDTGFVVRDAGPYSMEDFGIVLDHIKPICFDPSSKLLLSIDERKLHITIQSSDLMFVISLKPKTTEAMPRMYYFVLQLKDVGTLVLCSTSDKLNYATHELEKLDPSLRNITV